VAGSRLNEEFGEVLLRTQLAPPAVRLVEETLIEPCRAEEQEVARRRKLARQRVEDLQARRERLLDAYLYESIMDRGTYERRLQRLERSS
jgi:hypothetical protein